MILSTVSVRPQTPDEVKFLAEVGFDYISIRATFDRWTSPAQWPMVVPLARGAGIKVLLTWPEYADFDSEVWGAAMRREDPRYAFRAYDGRTNTQAWSRASIGGRLHQFSHWNDEVERALIASLPRYLEAGPEIDGLHVNVASNDRMFPTDWYPFGNVKGAMLYWSFDDSARVKWAQHSGARPMPIKPQPVLTPEGNLVYEQDEFFYRWYQNGWIGRLTRLTDAALDAGLKHISTWVLPHTRFTPENMADGTAGCIDPIEGWRQHVIERGGYPLVMVAHQFGLERDWPHWYADGEESIRRMCAAPYNWDLIVGAECDISPNITAANVRRHGAMAAEWGASGLLCGDSSWIGSEYAPAVAEAINDVRGLFRSSRSGERALGLVEPCR